MIKVGTLGEILVEILATETGQSFKRAGTFAGPYASGAPAIFIDQVARLGQPCGVVSAVGDDDFGRLNLERLAADGVDVSAVATDSERATGSAFVTYRADGAREFVFNMRHAACASTRIDAAAEALLAGCGHLHVVGSSLFSASLVEAAMTAIELVKSRGGTLSFDPNIRDPALLAAGMRGVLEAILRRTDIFLPSGPELTLLADRATEDAAIDRLLSAGVGSIVVKRGAAGASWHDRSGSLHAPAFRAVEVDPTGAGDCFGATFVVCRLRGDDVATSLRYANASGARTVTVKGPMEGVSSFAELDSFIAQAGNGA